MAIPAKMSGKNFTPMPITQNARHMTMHFLYGQFEFSFILLKLKVEKSRNHSESTAQPSITGSIPMKGRQMPMDLA